MPKKIILDCDPGHDDAVAIMLAIASDDIDLLGITCVGGNATLENTKLNALKICSLLKREDIPIYAGSDKPLKYDLVTKYYLSNEKSPMHSSILTKFSGHVDHGAPKKFVNIL